MKLGAKFMFDTLVMTWLTKLTSSEVTSLLLDKASCPVVLSTQGRISSIVVCSAGNWVH